MRYILLVLFLVLSLSAKNIKAITPSEVYAQVMLFTDEIHQLQKYYGVKHSHRNVFKRVSINTTLKPRNVWQLTYEIMIKINILRSEYKLPRVEPVNIEPVLNLNPDLVYEQVLRILTEVKIFKYRQGIQTKPTKLNVYKNKTPLDVFNALSTVSIALDELNRAGFTPSYVFGETMRVNDDLTMILEHLNITDQTIPGSRNNEATPSDTFNVALEILQVINKIQSSVGISTVDFSVFKKDSPTPSDVFTMNQMILSELQTIKAYVGLVHKITPASAMHFHKTPADVDQLMKWNLRKIKLLRLQARSIR